MTLTLPYCQHAYLGEFTNEEDDDAEVLQEIRNRKWDTNGNGTGNPRAGMQYFDLTNGRSKFHDGTNWLLFAIV